MTWLLLLVFSALQLLPALHFHKLSGKSQKIALENTSKKQVVAEDDADCPICDFTVHKQVEFQHSPAPVAIKCFAIKTDKYVVGYCQQLFERSVHTWTNKGPPVIS